MKKNRYKKVSLQNETILLIVENSEVAFFNQYFKQFLEENHQIKIICKSSGSGNKCEITNFDKMSKIINESIEIYKFKAVFLMIDLDSQCFSRQNNHNCLLEFLKDYTPKYKIKKELKDKFYLFVVCNEIESWFLTIDSDKKHTNNPHENHKKELMKLLKVSTEPQIIEKMIINLNRKKFKLDFDKNQSLTHFIKKLNQYYTN